MDLSFVDNAFPDDALTTEANKERDNVKQAWNRAALMGSNVTIASTAASGPAAPIVGPVVFVVSIPMLALFTYLSLELNDNKRWEKSQWVTTSNKVLRAYMLQLVQFNQFSELLEKLHEGNPFRFRIEVILSFVSFLTHGAIMKMLENASNKATEQERKKDLEQFKKKASRFNRTVGTMKKMSNRLFKRASNVLVPKNVNKHNQVRASKAVSATLQGKAKGEGITIASVTEKTSFKDLSKLLKDEMNFHDSDNVKESFLSLAICYEEFAKQNAKKVNKFLSPVKVLSVKDNRIITFNNASKKIENEERYSTRRADVELNVMYLKVPKLIEGCKNLIEKYIEFATKEGAEDFVKQFLEGEGANDKSIKDPIKLSHEFGNSGEIANLLEDFDVEFENVYNGFNSLKSTFKFSKLRDPAYHFPKTVKEVADTLLEEGDVDVSTCGDNLPEVLRLIEMTCSRKILSDD